MNEGRPRRNELDVLEFHGENRKIKAPHRGAGQAQMEEKNQGLWEQVGC